MSTFKEMLDTKQDEGRNLCIGIDPDFGKIPGFYRNGTALPKSVVMPWVQDLVENTWEYAAAFKPNLSFFEQYGLVDDLARFILSAKSEIGIPPFIIDFKRGDIGNTNDALVKTAFERIEADAVTLHPYLGGDSLEPFLKKEGKGFFILCRTSNPGSGEFQDLRCFPRVKDLQEIGVDPDSKDVPMELYKYVALRATKAWKTNGTIGLVTGGTYPEEISEIRSLVGDEPVLLIPGIGKQGGDLEKSVHNGMNSSGRNFLINVSSAISYPSEGHVDRETYLSLVREAALKYACQISSYREEKLEHLNS